MFIKEKIVENNLQLLKETLTNHTRIKYLGQIYFYGNLADLYTSQTRETGEERLIAWDTDNRVFISTGGHPRYMEITVLFQGSACLV